MERMGVMDEQERRERKIEAQGLEELEESGLEKLADHVLEGDPELVLVGDSGPVPYEVLLTAEEYREFRILAETKDPSEEQVARGQELLRLMMRRYPDGPAAD